MIKVSKMADYAVVLLAAMTGDGNARVSTTTLAARTTLPEPTVAKILKHLAREGLVESARGVQGGYRLSAAPATISVAAIIAAMDGPIALTACVDGAGDTCNFSSHCAMKGRWNGVNAAIRTTLENVSLADMVPLKEEAAA